MRLSSSSFKDGGTIPARYTCDGDDISPPLAMSGLPGGTQSLALICDDPDAPAGTWVHWVMYNLPADTRALDEAVPAKETLSDGSMQGTTDFRRIGYGGPCPPGGTHRYFFKLYALDTVLDLPPGRSKSGLITAMEGHLLAECRLIGLYSRG
jgi:Raf kinase inhibitor-like YbhB/YbcL family protein